MPIKRLVHNPVKTFTLSHKEWRKAQLAVGQLQSRDLELITLDQRRTLSGVIGKQSPRPLQAGNHDRAGSLSGNGRYSQQGG